MPELPEAETLVRGLRPLISGATIAGVDVHHADVLRVDPAAFSDRVVGRRITGVGRRAKNVLVHLDDGELVVNLGMTGWLAPFGFDARERSRPTHPALTFAMVGGAHLVFDDVRRFGCVEALDADTWQARSDQIGPEPLEADFTVDVLSASLARSRTPIRNWLLDQRRIAGVGNIYACEACFLARVHPQRAASTLTRREAQDLRDGIVQVLSTAVNAGGTTIRNYRNVHGESGAYVDRLVVYGREAQPCVACGIAIERIVLSNRSAFFCPSCQR